VRAAFYIVINSPDPGFETFVNGMALSRYDTVRSASATGEGSRSMLALLKDDSSWNRHDDKQCDDDDSTREWSLYSAIEAACKEVVGTCEHTRVGSQEVRFAIEEVARGKQFEGRLMGFNNSPETRFEDIKHVLRLARERVRTRLEESEGRRPTKH
jgi:hypothetical protein